MTPVDWEDAWEKGVMPWDEGQSPPALLRLLAEKRIPSGRAFVPGCGAGYDVATLAHVDREVIGLDVSTEARSTFFERHKDLPGEVSYEVGDFFAYDPTHAFDFVWDYTFFCALDPEQREPWARVMSRLVKPGGLLATLLFPYADPISPDASGPPWPVNTDLVRGLVEDEFELLEVTEAEHTHPGREGKERLALWRRKRRNQYVSGNGTAEERHFTSENPMR